jgi:hypothetical protein
VIGKTVEKVEKLLLDHSVRDPTGW